MLSKDSPLTPLYLLNTKTHTDVDNETGRLLNTVLLCPFFANAQTYQLVKSEKNHLNKRYVVRRATTNLLMNLWIMF